MPERQQIVLVIGDGGVDTGFSRIIQGILKNLPKDVYNIHQLALNYNGDPHELPWKLYPANSNGNAYGFNRIKELIEKLKPQIVYCLNDPWIIEKYLELLKDYAKNTKIIIYYSIDGGPLDKDWLKYNEIVSRKVVFSNFAKSELYKVLGPNERIEVLPPGIDTSVFFPYSDEDGVNGKNNAKKKLGIFKEAEIEDSFIVLSAHRNQPRKRLDITIKGFSLFAKGKPANVRLYLHTGYEEFGWNILKLCDRYGISERLICTENNNSIPGVSDEIMNLIYNACDIGVNTSYFEGWGFPNFEHAACKKAQIVPRINALAEIWEGCAAFLEPVLDFTQENTLCEGKIVSPDDLACSLEKLYDNPKYKNKIAEAGYEKVTKPEMSWENIGKRWHELFQTVIIE